VKPIEKPAKNLHQTQFQSVVPFIIKDFFMFAASNDQVPVMNLQIFG